MKAIRKFKSLLSPRPTSREKDHQHPEITPAPSSAASSEETSAPQPQSTAEFAARVLRERQEFLAKGGKASFDQLLNPLSTINTTTTTVGSETTAATHDQDQQQQQPHHPLLLGIGTGGIDAFPADEQARPGEQPRVADVVSDSPTAVDFNVYDRAFEAEVERIKRSTSRRGAGAGLRGKGVGGGGGGGGAGAGQGSGSGAGSGVIYQTRFSERRGGGGGFAASPWGFGGGGAGREPQQGGAGMRFADLVARAMAVEETREEMGMVPANGEGGGEGGSQVKGRGPEGQ